MSAFVAIKTTLSAAMAKRSTLLARTKKVLSRSRRAARSVPVVDVCVAQSSPCAAEAEAVVDETPLNITEAILDGVETAPAVVDDTTFVIETTQNAPKTIPNLVEAISANTKATTVTASMGSDVNNLNNEFSSSSSFVSFSRRPTVSASDVRYAGIGAEHTSEDELPSFSSFASYSLWPLMTVTEPIPSTPATVTRTIPQVIVTLPTEACIEAIELFEPEANIANSEEAKMTPASGEIEGPSAISTTASLDLAPLGSVAKEDANEASLAYTYVHGGNLFILIEADEPLESSVVESDMPSTLRSLPSPFSRGTLCIKDMNALTSSGPETESFSMTPSISASVDVGSDLFHGLLAIHASLPSVPAFRSLDSLETIPDEFEETLVQSSSSSASVMYAKLKQAVCPGDVDAFLRSLVVGEDDASLVF